MFARYGHVYGEPEKGLFVGLTLEGVCAAMAVRFGLPGAESRLQAELVPLVEEELGTGVSPMPGAAELVESLSGRIPIAVATNSPRTMLDDILGSSGLAGYFDATVAADEVAEAKPAPDVYLSAFGRIGAAPDRGVAIEDSPTGVAAARRAGSFVVAVSATTGGVRLAGDVTLPTLTDPRLRDWARRVVAV